MRILVVGIGLLMIVLTVLVATTSSQIFSTNSDDFPIGDNKTIDPYNFSMVNGDAIQQKDNFIVRVSPEKTYAPYYFHDITINNTGGLRKIAVNFTCYDDIKSITIKPYTEVTVTKFYSSSIPSGTDANGSITYKNVTLNYTSLEKTYLATYSLTSQKLEKYSNFKTPQINMPAGFFGQFRIEYVPTEAKGKCDLSLTDTQSEQRYIIIDPQWDTTTNATYHLFLDGNGSDFSGNRLNFSEVGAPNWSTTGFKTGTGFMNITANSQYLQLGQINDTQVGAGENFAMALWVKMNSTGTAKGIFNRGGSTNTHLIIRGSSGNMKFDIYSYDTINGFLSSTSVLNNGSWIWVLFQRNDTALSLFINNVQEAVSSGAGWNNAMWYDAGTAQIGNDGQGDFCSGCSLDDFRFYKKSYLDGAGRALIFNSGAGSNYPNVPPTPNAPLIINFTEPTEANNSYLNSTRNWTYINVSVTNSATIENFGLNLNGTNITLDDPFTVFEFHGGKDNSRYSQNFTLTNAVCGNEASGKFGTGCNFTSNQRSVMNVTGIFSKMLNNGSFSTMQWVYPESTQVNTTAGRIWEGVNTTNSWLVSDTATYNFQFRYREFTVNSTSLTSGTYGKKWWHVGTVYNGTHMFITINGVINNATRSIIPMTVGQEIKGFTIGNRGQMDRGSNVSIDEMHIYNRSLTEAEILTLYNMEYGRYFANASYTGFPNNVTYYAWANDSNAQQNVTETRIINFGVSNVAPIPITTSISNSTPRINETVLVNSSWFDDSGLSGYIIMHNKTSVWVNETWQPIFNNQTPYNFTIPTGRTSYNITFFVNDTNNVFNQTSLTFTSINSIPTQPTISSPSNNSYLNNNNITFIWNSTDADNDTLTGYAYLNGTLNGTVSGNFSRNLSDGSYVLLLVATDNLSNSSNSTKLLFTIDATAPLFTSLTNHSIGQYEARVNFTPSESVNYSLNFGNSLSLGTIQSSASFSSTEKMFTLSGLASHTYYYWNLTICDQAGSCAKNSSFFITAQAQSAGSSQGGGNPLIINTCGNSICDYNEITTCPSDCQNITITTGNFMNSTHTIIDAIKEIIFGKDEKIIVESIKAGKYSMDVSVPKQMALKKSTTIIVSVKDSNGNLLDVNNINYVFLNNGDELFVSRFVRLGDGKYSFSFRTPDLIEGDYVTYFRFITEDDQIVKSEPIVVSIVQPQMNFFEKTLDSITSFFSDIWKMLISQTEKIVPKNLSKEG